MGGCVRNILLNHRATDIDIATKALPEDMIELCKQSKIKYIPTGLKHGTITIIINDLSFEITTLRKDVETDGRHATIAFTSDWREDAARRDFTVNAMYMDLAGNIYDYFNGREDLASKLVKFVGDPETRIKEDYLRILRYFRFYSYFGGKNIDLPSLLACKKLASHLNELSGERIASEMFKILSAPYNVPALDIMQDNLIFENLGIKLKKESIGKCKFGEESLVNLAALIRKSISPEEALKLVKERWRLSVKAALALDFMVNLPFQLPNNNIDQSKALYKFGWENYIYGLKILAVENPSINLKELLDEAHKLFVPKFPIKGDDLLQLGYDGKTLGQILKTLEQKWLDSNFALNRDQLLESIEGSSEEW